MYEEPSASDQQTGNPGTHHDPRSIRGDEIDKGRDELAEEDTDGEVAQIPSPFLRRAFFHHHVIDHWNRETEAAPHQNCPDDHPGHAFAQGEKQMCHTEEEEGYSQQGLILR